MYGKPNFMQQFRLDRTAFTAQRMSDVKKQRTYWLMQPASARFEAAWYLFVQLMD